MKAERNVAVICFWYGDWPESNPALGSVYVRRLYNSVLRNSLLRPLDFIVLVDKDKYHGGANNMLRGLEVNLIPVLYRSLAWNLKKLCMFADATGLKKYDYVVCLDLDLVVTGPIDFLLRHDWPGITTCGGAYQPEEMGGSIIGFSPNAGWCDRLSDSLFSKPGWWQKMTNGSERYFYRIFFGSRPEVVKLWQDEYPGKILSFKTEKFDPGASVVRFHGKPRPHEVIDQYGWIKENWR